jgi:serine/threonine protein kinase
MGGINDGSDDEEFDENNTGSSAVSHSSTSITKQDFKILKVIGRGSFGKVYLV